MRSMTRRQGNAMGAPPADLLVCFPTRAHLTLMPKPVSSPARASDTIRHHRHHLLRKSATRSSQAAAHASPLLWAKTKPSGGGEMTSEPTSPKVTCAGQIKNRPKSTRSSRKWQSVMEEIERIHNHRKLKKKSSWGESLGFKREVFQFLSCLCSFRFGLRCFRGFPASDITTEDEDEEDEEGGGEGDETSRTIFSKWFMVLQEEDQDGEFFKQPKEEKSKPNDVVSAIDASSAPPPNALLLMRCRSAPAKSWLKEKPEQKEEEEEEEKKTKVSLKALMAEDQKDVIKNKESLVVMNYDTDFYKLSSDIAKETWVVSGSSRDNDPLMRCRSWKKW